MLKEKRVIGRFERVGFPELGIKGIEAKIDTGAYTTALHCNKIEIKKEAGKEVLFFEIEGIPHKTSVYHKKEIKNSFGDVEERYIIKTKVKMGKWIINSTISLSDRAGMRFPVLIGRKLLKKRFIVDVSKEYLL